MRFITRAGADIARAMYSGLDPWGRFWMTLGLATLCCAAAMSYSFGAEISTKHALFLVALTAIAAFLPEAAYRQWTIGKRTVGVALAVIAVPVLAIEFYSHAGYTAGLRGSNLESATVQNARYDARQDEVKEGRASLVMWEQRLAALTAEHGWTASVTAEALRAQLAGANLAIEQETKRGGCGPKCLERTKERDAISARIAIAEERSSLAAKIEATKRVVAASRDKAVTTEHKSSAVAHQNDFLARTVALVAGGSLEPSKIMTEGAQQTVNLAMALAGTGLPALALFVAGLYRRPESHSGPSDEIEPVVIATPAPRPQPRPVLHTATVADLKRLAAA
jgi:hypothetical protein